MFTGIVEEVGHITNINQHSISICCSKILQDIKLGDSISVEGVCLTVTEFNSNSFTADVSSQTKSSTKLGYLKKNDCVNLERAMLATSRFGGHVVTGHVDCVGVIEKLTKQGEFYDIKIEIPSKEYSKYIVKKGSVTINGISLTIYDLTDKSLNIAVIPHTYEQTSLKTSNKGDYVNIEFDILAKYVEKNISAKDNNRSITTEFLAQNGFV